MYLSSIWSSPACVDSLYESWYLYSVRPSLLASLILLSRSATIREVCLTFRSITIFLSLFLRSSSCNVIGQTLLILCSDWSDSPEDCQHEYESWVAVLCSQCSQDHVGWRFCSWSAHKTFWNHWNILKYDPIMFPKKHLRTILMRFRIEKTKLSLIYLLITGYILMLD